MRPFSIAWVPEPRGAKLLSRLGTQSLSFPHFVESSSNPDQLTFYPSEKTLSLGILVAGPESTRYLSGPVPTLAQMRATLETCCPAFGVPDADRLCVNAAAYLREQFSAELAIAALERALQIIPDAQLCRDDLAAMRFAQTEPTRADEIPDDSNEGLHLESVDETTKRSGPPTFLGGNSLLANLVLFIGGGIGAVAGASAAGGLGLLTGVITAFFASVFLRSLSAKRGKLLSVVGLACIIIGAFIGGWNWGWAGVILGAILAPLLVFRLH